MKNLLFTILGIATFTVILAIYVYFQFKKGQEKMANEEVKSENVTFLNNKPLL